MNLVPVEVEKNTNNVMAYTLNLYTQWVVNPAFYLVFLCLASLSVTAQEEARDTSIKIAEQPLLESSNNNLEDGSIADTIPYEHRRVNEHSNTSVTFYTDIQSYSAGLREVTRRTNLSLGYRILIISDRSDAVVSQVMDEFYRSFRNLPTYKVFNSPYTELKAGDFSNYLEASYWAYQMKSEFRGSYVVQEVVNRRKK